MKNLRIGCDIVSLRRFRKIALRTPSIHRRIFLPQEEKEADIKRLTGIFAAKEAIIKALNLPPGLWKEIEICYQKNGKPYFKLSKNISRPAQGDISIAHDDNYAIALAVFL